MAADFKIKVTKDRSREIIGTVDERIRDALILMGQQAERNAKLNLERDPRRVDTGLLRNSITYAYNGESPAISTYNSNPTHGSTDSTVRRGIAGSPVTEPKSGTYSGTVPKGKTPCVYVGTNVEYAPYVHYGTQNMAPNYFLRDSVNGHEPEFKAIADRVLRYG